MEPNPRQVLSPQERKATMSHNFEQAKAQGLSIGSTMRRQSLEMLGGSKSLLNPSNLVSANQLLDIDAAAKSAPLASSSTSLNSTGSTRISSHASQRRRSNTQPVYPAGRVAVNVSLVFATILLCFTFIDFIALGLESPESGVPYQWHSSLLYVHTISIYFCLSGYIVTNEASKVPDLRRAYAICGLNAVSYVMRLAFEINFHGYYPPGYYPPDL